MNPSPDNQQNNKLLALMLASFPCGNFHHCLLQVTNMKLLKVKLERNAQKHAIYRIPTTEKHINNLNSTYRKCSKMFRKW